MPGQDYSVTTTGRDIPIGENVRHIVLSNIGVNTILFDVKTGGNQRTLTDLGTAVTDEASLVPNASLTLSNIVAQNIAAKSVGGNSTLKVMLF